MGHKKDPGVLEQNSKMKLKALWQIEIIFMLMVPLQQGLNCFQFYSAGVFYQEVDWDPHSLTFSYTSVS